MMKYIVSLTFLLSIWITHQTSAQDIKIFRTPAVHPSGEEIAFSYQGDIWVVNSEGGLARRLTIHESYESDPRYDGSGDQIVFQGNRHGSSDIFTIDADGRQLQRRTFHSAGDVAPQWGRDGSIWFNSSRLWSSVEREAEIFRLDADESTPVRALGALGNHPVPHPESGLLAFERGTCRSAREAYQGPANRDIWLYNPDSDEYYQVTDFDGQDYMPDWGPQNRLYFLSARNGRYNIFYVEIGEDFSFSAPQQVTRYEDEGVLHFDVNANGDVVYAQGSDIYIMPAGTSNARAVDVDVSEDFRFYPVEKESFRSGANEYAVSPDESLIAFTIRGEIFLVQNEDDKSRTVRLTNHPYRDQDVEWLNDETLLFTSDRNGQNEIYKVTSADTGESNLFKTLKHELTRLTNTKEEEVGFVLSHDRDKIAIRRGRGDLYVADIDSAGNITNEKQLIDGWATPSGVAWSPDDNWLAYSMDDLDFNSEVYIHKADGTMEPVNVSMHPRGDYSPYWSADGSKLGFISSRNNADADIWFAWLKKEDWEKTRYDWEELDGEEENGKDDEQADEEEEMIIDLENIHRRIRQVTRQSGNEGSLLITKDGEEFIYTTNNGGRATGGGTRELKKIKWDGSDESTLLPKANVYALSWDKAGKKLYHIASGGRLAILNVSNKKSESRSFNARMTIDHKQEKMQVFDEAWRALKAGFYDPEFHGRDWNALREQYYDRAIAASTDQDFRYIYNLMLGQLDASHMGLYGSNPEDVQPDRTGYLGVEVIPVSNGVEITRVLDQTPAARSTSTLNVGEVITAVNGVEVTSDVNFWSLLDETRNERIYLDVQSENGTREVVIRPTSSTYSALYDEWVEQRRQLTEEYSDGRLGYIHIRGMNWPSFEAFERELMASGYDKEGIVIDVRYNGGGWTTDMLMAILNTRQHAYTIPRGATESLKNHEDFKGNYPYSERLPFPYMKVPTIALCNQNSYSNAEIFSHAYKTLDHGTLVGIPTFGAVISTGGQGLIDGSFVRMPFRAWYVKATGENMEHGPAVPDIIVEDPPQAKANGDDPQLKTAVDELLKQIDG